MRSVRATARVQIVMGGAPYGGVSFRPIRPAKPIPAIMEKTITSSDTRVPGSVLVNKKIVSRITRNIKGIRLVLSVS